MNASDLNSLLERIANGDKLALRELYDQHGPDIHRFISSKLYDAHEAADAFQETMMHVWQNAHKFESRSSARTWILSIARNKAIDRVRKLSRIVIKEADTDIPDDSSDALKAIESLEDAANLKDCLTHLSERHRSAVHLAFFDDLSYDEIAEIENCPVGTIKTRIHHAKKLLLNCLTKKSK